MHTASAATCNSPQCRPGQSAECLQPFVLPCTLQPQDCLNISAVWDHAAVCRLTRQPPRPRGPKVCPLHACCQHSQSWPRAGCTAAGAPLFFSQFFFRSFPRWWGRILVVLVLGCCHPRFKPAQQGNFVGGSEVVQVAAASSRQMCTAEMTLSTQPVGISAYTCTQPANICLLQRPL